MAFTITFLGTGTSSGVPMIGCTCRVCTSPNEKDKRLRSSILVQSPATTVVIDATPDFRQQMLRQAVPGIDAVLLTHPHKDHLGGLDDTRAFQFFQQRPTAIYGNEQSLNGVKKELFYAFEEKLYPGVPVLDLHEIDIHPFSIGDLHFIPVQVFHHKMKVFGYRIGPFTYITDANRIEDSEKEKIRGSKVLVLNALRLEKHLSHFTLAEAVALAQELEVPQTYLTHMSHQLGRHNEINAELPLLFNWLMTGCNCRFEVNLESYVTYWTLYSIRAFPTICTKTVNPSKLKDRQSRHTIVELFILPDCTQDQILPKKTNCTWIYRIVIYRISLLE